MTLTYLRMGADAAEEELEAAKGTGACLDHHAHDKPYQLPIENMKLHVSPDPRLENSAGASSFSSHSLLCLLVSTPILTPGPALQLALCSLHTPTDTTPQHPEIPLSSMSSFVPQLRVCLIAADPVHQILRDCLSTGAPVGALPISFTFCLNTEGQHISRTLLGP